MKQLIRNTFLMASVAALTLALMAGVYTREAKADGGSPIFSVIHADYCEEEALFGKDPSYLFAGVEHTFLAVFNEGYEEKYADYVFIWRVSERGGPDVMEEQIGDSVSFVTEAGTEYLITAYLWDGSSYSSSGARIINGAYAMDFKAVDTAYKMNKTYYLKAGETKDLSNETAIMYNAENFSSGGESIRVGDYSDAVYYYVSNGEWAANGSNGICTFSSLTITGQAAGRGGLNFWYSPNVSATSVICSYVVADRELSIGTAPNGTYWYTPAEGMTWYFQSSYSEGASVPSVSIVCTDDGSNVSLASIASGVDSDGNNWKTVSAQLEAGKTYFITISKVSEGGSLQISDQPIQDPEGLISIENAEIGGIQSQRYTGNPIEPEITVSVNGTILTKGQDYTVDFENNIVPGRASFTVTGIGNYTGQKTGYFFIIKAIQNFEFNPSKAQIHVGESKLITVVPIIDEKFGGVMTELTFESSDPAVAVAEAAEGGFTVTGIGVGTAKISVTAPETEYCTDRTRTFTVTVVEEASQPDPESLQLNHTSAEMATSHKDTGDSVLELTATALPEDASLPELVWTSSDEEAAAVDQNGKVTALTYGTATITATAKDNSSLTASCTIQTRFYDVAGSPVKEEEDYQYYFTPVYWAADHEPVITNGYNKVYFGTGQNCKREDMITFLWRAAGQPGYKKATSFKDVPAGKYYYKAIMWAAEKGITKGYSDGTFGVGKQITREDTVTFIYRAAGKPKYSSARTFKDVAKGKYYYDAIMWAAEKGITKGYSSGPYAGQFGVSLNVLREDIVTFLYRYAKL